MTDSVKDDDAAKDLSTLLKGAIELKSAMSTALLPDRRYVWGKVVDKPLTVETFREIRSVAEPLIITHNVVPHLLGNADFVDYIEPVSRTEDLLKGDVGYLFGKLVKVDFSNQSSDLLVSVGTKTYSLTPLTNTA